MAANHINGPREPFGYRRTDIGLEPIQEQLDALEKAFWYLDSGCPIKPTTDWLSKKANRSISPIGLRKLWLKRGHEQKES